MKPTPEEIKQIAIECGANFYAKDIQEFFTRAYELGWKNRGESDAELASGATAYTQFQTVEHYKIAAFIEAAIRNNTGE